MDKYGGGVHPPPLSLNAKGWPCPESLVGADPSVVGGSVLFGIKDKTVMRPGTTQRVQVYCRRGSTVRRAQRWKIGFSSEVRARPKGDRGYEKSSPGGSPYSLLLVPLGTIAQLFTRNFPLHNPFKYNVQKFHSGGAI